MHDEISYLRKMISQCKARASFWLWTQFLGPVILLIIWFLSHASLEYASLSGEFNFLLGFFFIFLGFVTFFMGMVNQGKFQDQKRQYEALLAKEMEKFEEWKSENN
ncbi:MAG: hypothetical protein OXH84_07420 [Gammaproteobacteria bacterium]|nr:hypothetical protein [Gammaproteobacteria bacterium]